MSHANKSKVTEVRLRKALRTVAIAIDCYGDVYWPIFEVLKAELQRRKNRHKQLAEFCNKKPIEDSTVSSHSRESANA